MKELTLQNDLKVFGVRVKTFPLGIGEAFDELKNQFPAGDNRSYYVLSLCTEKGIVYIAAAEEMHKGEAEEYGYETFVVEKGEYITEPITNWQQNLQCIKDVFGDMMKDERINSILPVVCVEWYKNMQEMLC